MELTIGTAGHIDHGKTSLVRALTGIDADRLPEEKRRGITIDIGFAEMQIGDVHFGFVDVPGHERFVKNMLAGASGIDIVLLVVAADEGVMPQTREHFEICRLLGLKSGIIALTKSDLVDEETLQIAAVETAELINDSFLADAAIVPVSSATGYGIERLKDELFMTAAKISPRRSGRVAFLPIDRSFSMKGFGAVVTGTLASGSISEPSEMELLPVKKTLRVRGLQSHGRTTSNVDAGQRTAVNLAGIDHSRIVRGMILAEPGVLEPTQIIDTRCEMLSASPRPLKDRQRIRVHIGTAEVLARVLVLDKDGEIAPGQTGFAQLRLETPIASYIGERFIIRTYSPQRTIGGGTIILPHTEKHRRRDIEDAVAFVSALADVGNDPPELVATLVKQKRKQGLSIKDLRAQTAWTLSNTEMAVNDAVSRGSAARIGEVLIDPLALEGTLQDTIAVVSQYHKEVPLAAGISREELRERLFKFVPNEIMNAVIEHLAAEGSATIERTTIRLAEHKPQLSSTEQAFADRLIFVLTNAGVEPPKIDEAVNLALGNIQPAEAKKILHMKLNSGELIKITDEFWFARAPIDGLVSALHDYADRTEDRTIDVAKFKEIARVSRKYAIPLLEFFDRERITVRKGDKRIVLK